MSKCSYCGKQIPDDTPICPKCKAAVEIKPIPKSKKEIEVAQPELSETEKEVS